MSGAGTGSTASSGAGTGGSSGAGMGGAGGAGAAGGAGGGGGGGGAGASCADAIKNGTESDIDCGGSCPPCANGKQCGAGSDCVSGVCQGGICVDNAGPDADGDGLTDVVEIGDGDPWTDKDIFNGVHARLLEQCDGGPDCSTNDTLAKVDACVMMPLLEEKDQSSGWDFPPQPDDCCSPGYDFQPAWTACINKWQIEWKGFINLPAGMHCFGVTGGTEEQCGALFFDVETLPAQTGGPAKCYNVAAGVYPIRWHYTIDNAIAPKFELHINYCDGGAASCAPAAALPASMLRPVYP